MKKYSKQYYIKNKANYLEANRRWAESNADKLKDYRTQYYIKNQNRLKKYSREYYTKHPKRCYESVKQWRLKNPEKTRQYTETRRTTKKQIIGRYTAKDIQRIYVEQESRCAYCDNLLKYTTYHVEHIIPIVRKGTSNFIFNIVLTCPFCNSSKKDKTPFEWADSNPWCPLWVL